MRINVMKIKNTVCSRENNIKTRIKLIGYTIVIEQVYDLKFEKLRWKMKEGNNTENITDKGGI